MTTLSEQLGKIVSGPQHPGHDYILSKYTYEDIFAIAGTLQKSYFSSEKTESICLCLKDKGLIAAALLAALTRPVKLIIPHFFSESVLWEMHQAHAFSKALLEKPVDLPPEVEIIVPARDISDRTTFDNSFVRHPDSEIVKLFTGGSTCVPRIWSKTIRNLFAEAIYHRGKMQVSPDDLFAATVPPLHIYGLLFSVLTPFVASATVIDDVLTYPHEIQTAISRNRASVLVSIPLHYKMLTEITFQPESLRWALSSAAELDSAVGRSFCDQTGLGITEIFGSTETGGIASRLRTEENKYFRPFDRVEWKITRNRLAIRSDFISPELPVDEEGFFITSDRVKISADDGFELAGRADLIVKVAGKRVDLNEVKNAITSIPNVKDAAVVYEASGNGRGGEIRTLVAADVDSGEIRKSLRGNLQSYAVPRRIRVVDKIPVSPAGKHENAEIRKLLDEFSNNEKQN